MLEILYGVVVVVESLGVVLLVWRLFSRLLLLMQLLEEVELVAGPGSLALGAVGASASAPELVGRRAAVVLFEVLVSVGNRRKPFVLPTVEETLWRMRLFAVL